MATVGFGLGLFVFACVGFLVLCGVESTSSYDYHRRPPPRKSLFVQKTNGQSSTTPEQVHISLVGVDKMKITWITDDFGTPSTVEYGITKGEYNLSGTGTTNSYKFMTYKSGEIHNVVIGPLQPNTIYYYRCGASNVAREFSFKTPPAQFPIKFAVVGDLGQTEWTNSTLQHISQSEYDVLLLPGDLSYADFFQVRWDSFGRLVEPLASSRPWMVTQGNHEIERIPILHPTPFTSFNSRWRMPHDESGSNSNLYYSFEVAGVHIIMLGSYTDFDSNSDQYKWLQNDLAKVDRKRTPWLVVLVHAPWYNTNTAHQGERESVEMKKSMEGLLYEARVDAVFTGHVHAYERFTRVYNNQADPCGPVHTTIGDGGNREGLAKKYFYPKSKLSVFREASFGHATFVVMNETHAVWNWHRNDDDNSVVADTVWLKSLASEAACSKKMSIHDDSFIFHGKSLHC